MPPPCFVTRFPYLLGLTVTLLFGFAVSQALAGSLFIIAQWDFNTATAAPYNSPAPEVGSGTATVLGMTNSYTFLGNGGLANPTGSGTFVFYGSSNVIGSVAFADVTANSPADPFSTNANAWRIRGSSPGNGWALQAPQYTQGAQFAVSTVGYGGVKFSADWFCATQGIKNLQVQYTDGSTWNNIGSPLVAGSNGWVQITQDFSAIAGVSNNPSFGVRLVSAWDQTASPYPNYSSSVGGQYNDNSGNWSFTSVTFAGAPFVPPTPTITAILPPNGTTAGGTAVTLVGSGFTGATSVTIGGTPVASFSVLSDTMIDAVTGAGTTGAADVVVTNAAGPGTSSGLYTYGLAPVRAGVVWRDQNTNGGTTNQYWRSITTSTDGSKLAAVALYGDIWTSTDSGAHWTDQNTTPGTTNTSWVSITSSADGTKLAAAAGGDYLGGDIWTSTDSGAHWTNHTAGTNASYQSWTSITSSADGTKLAAAAGGDYLGGDIWTSTDSGVHWTDQNTTSGATNKTWSSISSSADGTKLAAVVGGSVFGGDIWTSTDSGAHWTDQKATTGTTARDWVSIASSADGSKLAAVVYGGDIWISTDSGVHWAEQNTIGLTSKQWRSITSSADGSKLAAVVFPGDIWTSIDYGVHWTDQNATSSATSKQWAAVTSSADGSKLAAAATIGDIWTSSSAFASAPAVISPAATSVTSKAADLGGNVTSNGGAPLTGMGVVYAATALNPNPQLGGSNVTNYPTAPNTGVFTVNATGLTPGTSYSFAAYAINNVGTTYTTPVSTFSTIAAPSITGPASLPNWVINAPGYLQTITSTGGWGTAAYSVTSGLLPMGLTLSWNGVIGGTPTSSGVFSFTVRATDDAGVTGSQPYSITINTAISPASMPNWTADRAGYLQTITCTGGTGAATFAVTAGTLPPGLTLASNGVLSGAPTTAGAYSFTVTATDTVGATGTRTYTNVVINPALAIATTTLPDATINVSGYLQGFSATGGTGTVTFGTTSGALPAGMSLSTSGVIRGTPTAAGTFSFTITATDKVGATTSQSYSFRIWALPAIVNGGVPSQVVTIGGGSINLNLASYYNDANPGGTLTYALVSGSSAAYGKAVATGGSFVQLSPGTTHGSTQIVVSATDGHSPPVQESFLLTTGTANPSYNIQTQPGSKSTLKLNTQTGLLEQIITVTNTTGAEIGGFRIMVINLPSKYTLRNATAAPNIVDCPYPVASDAPVVVTLEYYSPTRSFGSFAPAYSVTVLPPTKMLPGSGVGEKTDQVVVLSPGVVLIEFAAILGHSYQIQYTDDYSDPKPIWHISPCGAKAGASRVQWIDRGPPSTAAPPVTAPVTRVYLGDDVTAN